MEYNSEMNEMITIVVITCNRYTYLERLLNFYEKHEFPFPILILDSSSDKDITPNLSRLMNDRRIRHKKYSNQISFEEKIARGVLDIKTRYCVLNADDDFLIPYGVSECIHFLENKPDYSIAQGFFIQHTIKRNRNGSTGFSWRPAFADQVSLKFDSAEDRLNFAWNGFNGVTFYSVFRTELLVQIWEETSAIVKNNPCLSETMPFILSILHSKIMVLPVFYISREMNRYEWLDNDLHRKFYAPENCLPVIHCWASHLSRLCSMNFVKSLEILKHNLDAYLLRVVGITSTNRGLVWYKEVIRRIVSGKGVISRGIRFFLWRWKMLCYWYVFKTRISREHRTEFYRELEVVKQIVIEANIDPDQLRRTREKYVELHKTG